MIKKPENKPKPLIPVYPKELTRTRSGGKLKKRKNKMTEQKFVPNGLELHLPLHTEQKRSIADFTSPIYVGEEAARMQKRLDRPELREKIMTMGDGLVKNFRVDAHIFWQRVKETLKGE